MQHEISNSREYNTYGFARQNSLFYNISMKFIGTLILIAAVLSVLFFGFITFIGKTMRSDSPNPATELNDTLEQQSIRAKQLREQQKRLLEQRQDMMRTR